METILIIEDDPTMLRGLKDNFEFKGYKVLTASDGEKGLDAALNAKPDLILLDIMLPKINGYEICRLIREQKLDMPVIMLTAKGEESDIVLGLNLGADDYVTKPFSITQLLARVEALLRRTAQPEPDVYQFGDFKLDNVNQKLTRNGVETPLSPKEVKVLQILVKKRGSVLTRGEILIAAFGVSHFISAKNIDVFIRSIREKIEPDLNKPAFIHTIGDIGYKFETV
jgi:DNA-binding response OmpR family regulator